MDKEEAIKILRELHDKALFSERTALETLHPEFKESEDERIRKELIGYIVKEVGLYPGEDRKEHKWLRWLEKQGQEPRKVPIWKHWKDGICGNGEGKLIYLIKNGDDYSLSSCLGYECDYILLSDLDNLMLDRQGTSYTKRDVDDAYVEGMVFAKDELEKQKPSWSKEDEIMIANIRDDLFCYQTKVRDEDHQLAEDIEKEINWFKSLKDRYTWKPSDEQMHYLNWIANIKLGDSVVEQEVSKHLNELLEQLKKLREE